MRGLALIPSIVFCGACFSPSDDGDLTVGATSTGSTSAASANATDSTSAADSASDPSDATAPETGSLTSATTGEGEDDEDTTAAPVDTTMDPSDDDDDSTSSGEACGNGEIEGVEECDGTEGCTPTCELEHFECHPVLQVGCPDDSQCIWDVYDDNFTCSAMGDVGYGGACTSLENLYCEPGHICANAASLSNCASSGCCTNYCDTDNGDADCFAPLSCVSFWQVGFGKAAGPGLDDVGICVIP